MKTIKERAFKYCKNQGVAPTTMTAYMDGATEQKAIDDKEIKKLKSIVENSAIVLGIGGVEWINENARQVAIEELRQEIFRYYEDN